MRIIFKNYFFICNNTYSIFVNRVDEEKKNKIKYIFLVNIKNSM